ncbi:MAG: HAD family hydrolase [Anaerotruncus sp.]|nr:HAD family hydrolase [Anaerotruncus sp.]
MIRLVIFDLDGTLLNTLDDLAAAGNHVLAEHGMPTHPVEAFKIFVGDGIRKLVERMCPPDTNEEMLVQLHQEYNRWYGTHSEDQTRPYPGIIELLDQLLKRGVHTAVLSNKPHPIARALCPRYFGDRLMLVHGQREGFPRKPDRALVDEILQLTGTSAAQCLYVGDSGVDMQTAKNSGVTALGAAWGFRSVEELRANGADAILEKPADLLKFLVETT